MLLVMWMFSIFSPVDLEQIPLLLYQWYNHHRNPKEMLILSISPIPTALKDKNVKYAFSCLKIYLQKIVWILKLWCTQAAGCCFTLVLAWCFINHAWFNLKFLEKLTYIPIMLCGLHLSSAIKFKPLSFASLMLGKWTI